MIRPFSTILKSALIALAFISANTYAEVRLELGEGVSLLAVNGKSIESDSLIFGTTTASLPAGSNQILVHYTADVKRGDDSELEVSQPSVILFTTQAQKIYLTAPKIKSAREVKKFEESLNWRLADQKGNAISYKAALLIKHGFQLSRDYESELRNFNMSNSPAAMQQTQKIRPAINTEAAVSTQPAVVNSQIKAKSQEDNNTNMALDMLIYWYNQADEKTRRSFKNLINN